MEGLQNQIEETKTERKKLGKEEPRGTNGPKESGARTGTSEWITRPRPVDWRRGPVVQAAGHWGTADRVEQCIQFGEYSASRRYKKRKDTTHTISRPVAPRKDKLPGTARSGGSDCGGEGRRCQRAWA